MLCILRGITSLHTKSGSTTNGSPLPASLSGRMKKNPLALEVELGFAGNHCKKSSTLGWTRQSPPNAISRIDNPIAEPLAWFRIHELIDSGTYLDSFDVQ